MFAAIGTAIRVAADESPKFQSITVRNADPRRDVKGEIVDAHDGCLQFFAGRYYLYGTAYGKSAGYSINNRFRVYSSPDLQHWNFEGELLKEPPDGVYYRPYVVRNPKTGKYILWYNWYPKLWEGQVGVAISDTPVGPFTIVNAKVHLSQAEYSPGDGSPFVDEDGIAYFIYTAIDQDHSVRVERLTADFLGSSGEASKVLGTDAEAPAMFRRDNRYYALFDTTCCFCSAGSGARVLVAASPLGPYREMANINRRPDGQVIVPAQQTFVAGIPAKDGTAFLWMADRWGSRPDGIKGHDLQFWSAPLRFASDGAILPIENVDSWKLTIELGSDQSLVAEPYIWPRKKDPHPLKIDPCTQTPLPPED